MTLQKTGPISFNDIQTEFTGTNPINFSEYYAGSLYNVVGATHGSGMPWTSRTSAADKDWIGVCYGNGTFVAVSRNNVTSAGIMTSPDGITWTSRTPAADNDWRDVCYGNGLFVAVSQTGTGNRVMTSSDGITWTSRTSAADNNWDGVTYGNGLFVAVASSGTGNRVMTSSDGITWTSRTSAADNSWRSVCYGNSLFVAVASSGTGNRVMTSSDGITWTSRTSAADNAWYSVSYGNSLFVAVANSGTGNRVMTSSDGITWTSRTSAADNDWYSVCFGNSLFVAVANSGTGNRVMTSSDGITWNLSTSAVDNEWYSVCYGNSLFVAVAAVTGTGNRVMTISESDIVVNRRVPGTGTISLSTFYGSAKSLFHAAATSYGLETLHDLDLYNDTKDVVVAGRVGNASGGTDCYVARITKEGSLVWERTMGLYNAEVCRFASVSIDQTTGDIYCVGNGNSTPGAVMLVVKYNSSGTLQWQRHHTAFASSYNACIYNPRTSLLYAVGRTSVNSRGLDITLNAFNSSGTLQWSRQLSSTNTDEGTGVAIDISDNVYVVGTALESGTYNTAYVAKYNSSGTLQWQRRITGSTVDSYYQGVCVDPQNNVICVGYNEYTSSGNIDAFVTKYNSSGTLQWQRLLGGTNADSFLNVDTDADGNVFCIGYTESDGAGS